LSQKSLSRKNESLTNVDVTISTNRIDFKSTFLARDLKPVAYAENFGREGQSIGVDTEGPRGPCLPPNLYKI